MHGKPLTFFKSRAIETKASYLGVQGSAQLEVAIELPSRSDHDRCEGPAHIASVTQTSSFSRTIYTSALTTSNVSFSLKDAFLVEDTVGRKSCVHQDHDHARDAESIYPLSIVFGPTRNAFGRCCMHFSREPLASARSVLLLSLSKYVEQ